MLLSLKQYKQNNSNNKYDETTWKYIVAILDSVIVINTTTVESSLVPARA